MHDFVFSVLLLLIVMLLSLMFSLCVAYYVCFRITKKRRDLEDRVGLMPKKKKVSSGFSNVFLTRSFPLWYQYHVAVM